MLISNSAQPVTQHFPIPRATTAAWDVIPPCVVIIELFEGDVVSVDGANGDLYLGKVATMKAERSEAFNQFMQWSEEVARLNVRMNAETPQDIEVGYQFGATGIGLHEMSYHHVSL